MVGPPGPSWLWNPKSASSLGPETRNKSLITLQSEPRDGLLLPATAPVPWAQHGRERLLLLVLLQGHVPAQSESPCSKCPGLCASISFLAEHEILKLLGVPGLQRQWQAQGQARQAPRHLGPAGLTGTPGPRPSRVWGRAGVGMGGRRPRSPRPQPFSLPSTLRDPQGHGTGPTAQPWTQGSPGEVPVCPGCGAGVPSAGGQVAGTHLPCAPSAVSGGGLRRT